MKGQVTLVVSLLLMLCIQGHNSQSPVWVGTGVGVLATASPVTANSFGDLGYGLMSTPRMTGTNQFDFFSSSDAS